jgi:hypothetical protein
MDQKERLDAANALVQWFNSQEISPSDASAIMSKVQAKIFVGAMASPSLPETRSQLYDLIDRAMLQLIHDMNDRLFATKRSQK